MALDALLSIAELILLASTALCSLIVAICVGLSKKGFDGNCALFSEVHWCNATAVDFTNLGKAGACHYIILVQVIAAFLALLYGLYHILYLFQWMKEYKRFLLPGLCVCFFTFILVFVCGCLLSIGFKRFCSSLTSGDGVGSKIKSCGDPAPNWGMAPKCVEFKPHNPIRSTNYFGLFTTAQGACWFGTLFWALIVTSVFIRRVIYKPSTSSEFSDKAPIATNIVT